MGAFYTPQIAFLNIEVLRKWENGIAKKAGVCTRFLSRRFRQKWSSEEFKTPHYHGF